MASQALYDGDWYECVVATSAGESPDSAPTKWSKLSIPEEWAPYLVAQASAFAFRCRQDFERANAEEIRARVELDRIALDRHRENGRGRPIRVLTR